MKKLFLLLFLIVLASGCTLGKKPIQNIRQDKSIGTQEQTENTSSSIIKFVDNNFSLYYIEEINHGLAMYYSPNEENFKSKSKLIINQYGKKIKAKDLADGVITESEGRGATLYSPFTAPDSKKREAYYIAFREFIDERDENPTTDYLMKVFEIGRAHV